MDFLIVDDDQALGAAVCMLLELQGHTVEHASLAVKASTRMLAKPWDLILLDWELPDGNGLDLCRSYRAQGGLAPIIMMTGRSSLEDKEAGLEAGADDYIVKPFHHRELTARIKSMLRRATHYSPAAALRELDSGSIIAERYKLESQIGKGGMATLWLAEDGRTQRQVVIKIVHGHLLGTEEVIKRFRQEWQLLSTVQDANVVMFLDAGALKSGTPFLVMEYIKGRTLRFILGTEGPLPPRLVLECVIQICSGLEAIHKQGMVHRDLKPENIILQDDAVYPNSIKIVDFGLARLMELSERLTREDLVVGTLEYVSPEQWMNTAVDGRTDIYTLGILFFELLTGTTPFVGDTPELVLARHMAGATDPPGKLRAGIHPAIDAIVLKALSKEPAGRYQNAAEMRADLLNVLANLPQ